MAVVPWKPNTQGDTSVHNPTIRFSHSSQTANAANAAIARIAITRPERVAFWEIFPAAKPNIHGETNRIAPRTRLATSHNFALVQSFMTHPPLKICKRKLTGDQPLGFHGNGTFGETNGPGAPTRYAAPRSPVEEPRCARPPAGDLLGRTGDLKAPIHIAISW